MLFGNGAGITGTFAIVTIILLIFAVGYVAMARHLKKQGRSMPLPLPVLAGAWVEPR